MRRYYFDLFNGEVTLDEEGTELPDDDAAREFARHEVQYQAAESVRHHAHLVRSHKLVVCGENRLEIETITFGDVVRVTD